MVFLALMNFAAPKTAQQAPVVHDLLCPELGDPRCRPSKLYVQAHFNGRLHSESETSAVSDPCLINPSTAVYALITDFQAIPDAGTIFVGGDERLYRAGFAPGFSRI